MGTRSSARKAHRGPQPPAALQAERDKESPARPRLERDSGAVKEVTKSVSTDDGNDGREEGAEGAGPNAEALREDSGVSSAPTCRLEGHKRHTRAV